MTPEATGFPASSLIRIEALGLADHALAFEGLSGHRSVSGCKGGHFSGRGVSGDVAAELSNEWRQGALGAGVVAVEGLVTLKTSTGETILMKYIGRGNADLGATSYRIGAVFEASCGELDWLNDVCAAGRVTVSGADLHFELFELLGKPGPDSVFLEVTPLYQMRARDSIGQRNVIHGQVADRYLTMAGEGCLATGALEAEWLKGFSWGPHRMGKADKTYPWQIDMRVGMRTAQGTAAIQQYIGTVPRQTVSADPAADRSWRTVAVFETEGEGPLAWINGVVALGIGWKEANEAQYLYYVLR